MDGRYSIRLPSYLDTALKQVTNELDYQAGPNEEVTKSDVIRDSLEEKFANLASDGELPEETRDLLDDDLIANAGGSDE